MLLGPFSDPVGQPPSHYCHLIISGPSIISLLLGGVYENELDERLERSFDYKIKHFSIENQHSTIGNEDSSIGNALALGHPSSRLSHSPCHFSIHANRDRGGSPINLVFVEIVGRVGIGTQVGEGLIMPLAMLVAAALHGGAPGGACRRARRGAANAVHRDRDRSSTRARILKPDESFRGADLLHRAREIPRPDANRAEVERVIG